MRWLNKIFKRHDRSTDTGPPPCNHQWVDFPWYSCIKYNRYTNMPKYGSVQIDIIEPYVCCFCKERENKVLVHYYDEYIKKEAAFERYNEICSMYEKQLQPRAIVEDQIADLQKSIDKDYLKALAILHPERLGAQAERFKNET